MRRAAYAIDDALKTYFALDRVLQDGVFWTASRSSLGSASWSGFDIPVPPGCAGPGRSSTTNGEGMALFYGDYFAYDSKSGGAWMDVFVEPVDPAEQRLVIYNVCNYTRPQSEQSALLRDEVITLFHESGFTALHGCLPTSVMPASPAPIIPRGILSSSVANLRTLASHPQVFVHHVFTIAPGEPMPEALRDNMLRGNFQ